MSFLTVTYALTFYFAAIVFVFGLAYRIRTYAKSPAPLKIPTTPAPTTRTGVVVRMLKELTVFESLFKSNKWIWLFGILFHAALLLAFIRHLRYILPDWSLLVFMQPFGKYASFAMVIGLGGLLVRRIVVDRVRYISAPSDYLMLVLIIAIAASGMLMTFVEHTDIVALKAFLLGLIFVDWNPLPTDLILLVHLALVALLMIIFPFSKLLHAPGVFFSPTRNQVDNPREHRHIAAWAAKLETSGK